MRSLENTPTTQPVTLYDAEQDVQSRLSVFGALSTDRTGGYLHLGITSAKYRLPNQRM